MNKELVVTNNKSVLATQTLKETIYKNLIENTSEDFRSPADWAYKLARRPVQIDSKEKNRVLYLSDLSLKITLPDDNGDGYDAVETSIINPSWTVIDCEKLYTEPFGYMKFELIDGIIHFNLHYNSFLLRKSLLVECRPVLFESIAFDIVNKTIRYESATDSNEQDDIVRMVRALEIDGYFINRKDELVIEVEALCLTNPAFKKAAEECKLSSILKHDSSEIISSELTRYIICHTQS